MSEDDARVVSIVDDDPSVRRSLRNLLGSAGFRAEAFPSAEAFLASVHRQHTACIVLDVRMPGMSGLDLLRYLADTRARIPVIMLTAHAHEDTRQRTLQAGAAAFFKKPFDSAELVEAVRAALSTT